jgi:hypothetical protein
VPYFVIYLFLSQLFGGPDGVGVTDGVTDGEPGAQYEPHGLKPGSGTVQAGPKVNVGKVLEHGE